MAEDAAKGDGKFWEEFWLRGVEKGEYFDREGAIPILHSLLSNEDWMPVGTGSALIPGMGRGYDLEAIARSDKYSRVVGMDISPEGCRIAKSYLDNCDLPRQIHQVVPADFFAPGKEHDGVYDLVIDYTFLCALPLKLRKDWGKRMGELIKPGGSLLTFIYPIKESPLPGDGPPFVVSFEIFPDLLVPHGFKAADGPRMLADEQCHPDRTGKTGYARWVKQE